MANLQGDSPVLGPKMAMLTLSSGGTVVLLCCKSLISGLGHPQGGYKLLVRFFCMFVYWCFSLLSSVFRVEGFARRTRAVYPSHSCGQFSAFGPSLWPHISF